MNAKHILSKLGIIKKFLGLLGFAKTGYRLKHNEAAFGVIPKVYSTIVYDSIVAFIVVYCTLLSFIDEQPTIISWSILKHCLSYVSLLTGVFILTEVHKIAWSTMGLKGIKDIFFSLLIVTVIYSLIVRIMSKSFTLPDSYVLVVMSTTFFSLLASRLGYNILRKKLRVIQQTTIKPQLLKETIFIIGDDDQVRQFMSVARKHFHIAGILTDNSHSIGSHINGVEIVGNALNLGLILKKLLKRDYNIDRIVVTKHVLCKGYIRSFLMENNGINVPIHSIDVLMPHLQGNNYQKVPTINIQDTFNSDIVASYKLDEQKLYEEFSGQNILIAGNNIKVIKGIIRRLQSLDIKSMIFTGMPLEQLEEIRAFFESVTSGVTGHFIYTDISCYQSLRQVFIKYKPQKVIFFASSIGLIDKGGYCSNIDLLKSNLLVPSYIAKLAFQEKISDIIMISSNKVENQNTIGATCSKIAEDYALSIGNYSGNKYTNFAIVRWDNIAGQSNSVTSYFTTQLESGSDVIINGEENSERILSIEEAVHSILYTTHTKTPDSNYRPNCQFYTVRGIGPISYASIAIIVTKLFIMNSKFQHKIKVNNVVEINQAYDLPKSGKMFDAVQPGIHTIVEPYLKYAPMKALIKKVETMLDSDHHELIIDNVIKEYFAIIAEENQQVFNVQSIAETVG